MSMRDDEIRAIVVETLAEQQRLQRDSIDAIVAKAVASILTSLGIEDDDRREVRADLEHLRRVAEERGAGAELHLPRPSSRWWRPAWLVRSGSVSKSCLASEASWVSEDIHLLLRHSYPRYQRCGRIRAVDGGDEEVAEVLEDLHRQTFFDSAVVPRFDWGSWWIAYHGAGRRCLCRRGAVDPCAQ